MRWRTVLFDFDGTLFDTVDGITKSIQYALRKHGMDAPLEALRCFAGPPLADKFTEVFGVSRAEAEQLVIDFRERYVPIGVYESAPFPGIGELLNRLRGAGLKLAVATSKPQAMAELLLDRAGLSDRFDAVVGIDPARSNEKKWQIVEKALDLLQADRASAVLVGDTKYDAEGAARCGIACVGARWGYAAPGELEQAGVAVIAEDFTGLERLLTE